ncbi:MAG: hypothetical protein U0K81_06125 [Paludibacteraceae bacterium]|nr:hypothetical protein [Paludibacteraceae bacterium]
MGKYYDMVKANYNKLRNDDNVMWGHIEMWDKHLENMREPQPDKYWDIMRKTHEMMYGMHFDAVYAEWQVEHMYHIGDDGREYIGEHWSLKETTTVMQKYRARIPGEYNEYDFYVALNTHWHDTICTAKRHFSTAEDAETYVIDEAVAVWFNDQDWPSHDKVWRYFRCR